MDRGNVLGRLEREPSDYSGAVLRVRQVSQSQPRPHLMCEQLDQVIHQANGDALDSLLTSDLLTGGPFAIFGRAKPGGRGDS